MTIELLALGVFTEECHCLSAGAVRELAIEQVLADTTSRLKLVSSALRIFCWFPALIFLTFIPLNGRAQSKSSSHSSQRSGHTAATAFNPTAGPKALFQQGEKALAAGDLDQAESCFRKFASLDPQSAGAYANLGVIAMRRRQWPRALEMLHKAEKLDPKIAGIRLNIGLVYFRQNDFQSAIAPFASVVRDQPDSVQARYLLGLCNFLTDHYADAVTALEPLWDRESDQLNYLYVLGNAANKANRPDLEQRALGRMVEIGQDTPEFHLFIGKAHINREEYDDAIKELELAAKGDPKLPFVHFNLGFAYLKKQDLERARTEFLKDIEVEPDSAFSYDQLGLLYSLQQQDEEAEKYLRKALQIDSRMVSSHYQLARVYQREGKYAQALAEIDAAGKADTKSYPIHYVRGQILQKLGRSEEAKKEIAIATQTMNSLRSKRQEELYSGSVPSPELTQPPK